ncbi:hypothetical protein CH373_00585 [Leptospira perolatii]|uniref:Lipoprotein n=1 Tax=Leptospira perolatii TaxID=2023191 RepID=A0A2M9ZRK0_9LEPT|nr:hypothetical protein [Leptospira perolatii]PJZ71059.1 hypothetical protein CH360_00585 [Leptospira perolatii]PJZ74591.1 hypothetical protein CH373_00585 [Leptospira perolatii]
MVTQFLQKSIVLTLASALLGGCLHKSPQAAEFFSEYFQFQDAIDEEFQDTQVRKILGGFPDPESEKLLVANGDLLTLGMILSKDGTSYKPTLSASPPKVHKSTPYSLHVEVSKSEFKEQGTYKIVRKTEMLSTEFSFLELFPKIETLAHHLQNPHSAPLSEVSTLQHFLCEKFECKENRSAEGVILSYSLSDKTKESFPKAYKKLKSRGKQASFRFKVFKPGGFEKGWEFFSEGTSIFLKIPKSAPGYWANPSQLRVRFALFLNVYGLKIDIQNLGITLFFKRQGQTDIVSGVYNKVPSVNITGRFLRIFPPGVVDFFLPGNIHEYFENYFELLVHGSDKNGGNRFVSTTFRNGNRTKVTLVAKSEILRERFIPFSGKEEEDSPSLDSSLQDALIKDLRGSHFRHPLANLEKNP